MSEVCIEISKLNDFIFCPVSIYFHDIDNDTNTILLQDTYQLNGTDAHKNIDSQKYSSLKRILQSTSVYSEKYNLIGKIDTFDIETGILTERKRKIKVIYEGYVFQLYGQYFALTEMGYRVNEIRLHSLEDNKTYPIPLPNEDLDMLKRFEELIDSFDSFDMDSFKQSNTEKCKRCIYRFICSYTDLNEEEA